MGSPAHDHEAAASRVLDALRTLGQDWTVLDAPRFGLEQPDAVVLHPAHGVCVVTASGLRPGAAERGLDGLLTVPDHPERRLAEQPHLAAERAGAHVYDAHYAGLDDPNDRSDTVRWLLVAPFLDDVAARDLFGGRGGTAGDIAVTTWGSGFAQHVEHAVTGRPLVHPGSHTSPTPPGSPTIDRIVDPTGLRRVVDGAVLGPSDATPPPAAQLQVAARSIVAGPPSGRARRLRGPGGSGKTFALTARAAELAAQRRRVLVLSFTTTLADRLTDLVVERCAERAADARLVTVTNFHALCEHAVDLAEGAGYTSVWPDGARWPVAIVERARQVIDQGFEHRYDAILVDEGQDFSLEWWKLLRDQFAAADAELLVTVDPTQDLYRVEPWFDDDTMTALGFDEPWVELEHVVRTPPDLVPAIDVVAMEPESGRHGRAGGTLPAKDRTPATASAEREQLVGPAEPSVLRWVDIDRVADLGREIGREVVRLVRDHPTLSPGDVVFLCDYHHDGLAAVREIERAGIPVHHQFSRDPAGRGVRRRRFWVGSAAVKGATVHGFKGWEAGAIVMGIGADATSVALASVAIERVASPTAGESAIVTVVSGDRSRRARGAALEVGRDGADAPLEPVAPVADAPLPTPRPDSGPAPTEFAPPMPAMPPPSSPPPSPPPATPGAVVPSPGEAAPPGVAPPPPGPPRSND